MAEKIIKALGFPSHEPIILYRYCELINLFLNKPLDQQKRLAFELHDQNSDNFVCPADVYESFALLKENDHTLAQDLTKVN
jgi:hypothetical protein